MKQIKNILTLVGGILTIIFTFFYPMIIFYLGKGGTETAYLYVLGLSAALLLGWVLIIRSVMYDVGQWSFDLGCAWGQYLQSDHFNRIGRVLNQQMFEDGFSIFARSDEVLKKFYADMKYEFPNGSSHAIAVSNLLNKNYDDTKTVSNGQTIKHWTFIDD